MAVSLVSTGVQFPDSTIQTTAAGASAMVKIQTQTFSGSSGVDFTSGLTSTYKNYMFVLTNLQLGTPNGDFRMNFSSNGGSTYAVGIDYIYTSQNVNTNAWSYTQYNTNSPGYAIVAGQLYTDGTTALSGTILLGDPSGTSLRKYATCNFSGRNGTGIPVPYLAAVQANTTSAINAIRFTGTGNISGTIILYGLVA